MEPQGFRSFPFNPTYYSCPGKKTKVIRPGPGDPADKNGADLMPGSPAAQPLGRVSPAFGSRITLPVASGCHSFDRFGTWRNPQKSVIWAYLVRLQLNRVDDIRILKSVFISHSTFKTTLLTWQFFGHPESGVCMAKVVQKTSQKAGLSFSGQTSRCSLGFSSQIQKGYQQNEPRKVLEIHPSEAAATFLVNRKEMQKIAGAPYYN